MDWEKLIGKPTDGLPTPKNPWGIDADFKPYTQETLDELNTVASDMPVLESSPNIMQVDMQGQDTGVGFIPEDGFKNLFDGMKNTDIYKKYMYSNENVLREVKEIHIQTGIPENAMLASPAALDEAREIKRYRDKQMKIAPSGINDFSNESIYEAYPGLRNLNETDTAIALENITNIKVAQGITENVYVGWQRALANYKMNSIVIDANRRDNAGLTEKELTRYNELENNLKGMKETASVFDQTIAGVFGQTAEQAPRLVRGFAKGQATGIALGAATGTLGLVASGPAGAAAAASWGYKVGARYGMMADMLDDMVASYYMDFYRLKDTTGTRLLSNNEIMAAAIVVGTINTGIEFANYDTILGAISGGKGGAIKDIIANYKNHPALMQGLQQYLQVKGKESLKVAAGELNEEGLQKAVDRIANHILTNRINPNNYYKKETTGQLVASLPSEYAQGASEVIPAVMGMTAGLNVGGQLKAVRQMAQYQRLENEQIMGDFQTSALNSLAKEMSSNPEVQALYKKDPDIAKQVLANQMPDTLKETRVDTEMALQEENGIAFVEDLAKKAGISPEELQQTIENKAELVVPTEIYFQTRVGQGASSNNMDNHISASVDAHSLSRRKYYVEELRKNADALINKESQKQEQLLDNLIKENFPDVGIQQDTATEIIYTNPNNPADGWQQAYKDTNAIINNELIPLVEKMQHDGKQGVSVVGQEERDGRGFRSSNNPLWYQNLYKRLGRTPSNADYKRYAFEVLTDPVATEEFHGISMQGESIEETTAMQEDFNAKKEMLGSLYERKQVLENIKDRMQNMTATEIGITKGLSKDGYKVYQQVKNILATSTNADVAQAARMGAILFARHADRVAEIMNGKGAARYTAQDYASDYFGGIALNSTVEQLGDVDTFNQYGIPNTEFERQKQALKEKYQNTDMYLKAPNSKQSNLSEDQWLTVRTNAFKRWFGNWSFNENTEIKVTDLSELITENNGEMFIGDINLKDTSNLREWLKKELIGKSVTVDADSMLVGFSTKGITSSLKKRNSKGQQQQRSAYGALEEIIKNAVFYDFVDVDTKEKHVNLIGQDIYYSAFSHGGKQFCVKIKLDIAKDSLTANYKDHRVKEIKIEPIANDTGRGKNSMPYPHIDSILVSSILKANNLVKPKFSKVVDENGEPKIVYHGTNAEFSTFDKSKGGSITDAKSATNAFFFTDDTARSYATYATEVGDTKELMRQADAAERKGNWALYEKLIAKMEELQLSDRSSVGNSSVLMPVFLNGNFFVCDANGKTPKQLGAGDMDSGLSIVIEKAKKDNYDGVIFKNLDDAIDINRPADHFAVFSPNQIKSIDNIGTFSTTGNIYNQSSLPSDHKAKQLELVLRHNPPRDDYHLIIRKIENIKTAREVFGADVFEGISPDFQVEDAKKALATGLVKIYSSNPFSYGSFVSTSKMMAKDYAGGGKIYEKVVSVDDVAWLDEIEGQYAPVSSGARNVYSQGKDVKGAINLNQAKAIIHIFEHADQSTFLHELGHLFLRDLKMLAEMKGTPDWVQKDWRSIKEWLGYKDEQTSFTVKQHEKFADAFLGYLRTGQAPTSGLKYVFRQFKQWLSKLYKDFLQLGGEPSHEIKNVMSRMIATQDEVNTSIALAKWEDFKRKGGAKFLDDKTSTLYEKWQKQAKEEAYEKALQVAMKDISNKMQQERQELLDKERATYRELLLENNRLFKAEQLVIRTGDIERVSIFDYEVEEFKRELANNGGSLDGAVDKYMVNFTKQLDAADINQDSIKEMAETAVRTSRYQELIAALELKTITELNAKANRNVDTTIAEIEKILTESKDVDLLTSLSENEFKEKLKKLQYSNRWNLKELGLIKALQSDKANLLSNFEKLKKSIADNKKNIRVLRDEAIGTSKEYKDYAYVRLSNMPLHQAVDYKQWIKKAKDAERMAMASLVNNKSDEMLSAKRAQLLYQAMATQAELNHKDVHKAITKLTDRLNSIKKAHIKMPAQERYHYHNLLNVFGIEKTKAIKLMTGEGTLGELFSKYGNDFDIWYDGTSDIDTPLVPAFISIKSTNGEAYSETGSKITSYNSLTLDEFAQLNDILNMIYTMGRDAFSLKTMTDANGNSLLVEDVVAEIVNSIKTNVRANVNKDTTSVGDSRSNMQKFYDSLYEFHLAITKMETMFNTIDGGKHGPAQKYLMGILEAAYKKEYSMQESAAMDLMSAFNLYKGLSVKTNEDGLDVSFERYSMYNKKQYRLGTSNITKENLLVLALNWGTEINRKRVMDGHELSEIDVEGALANLDSRDWEFVHRIWALMSKHWEDTVKVEEHMTGVGLEKQKAASFKITDVNGNVHEVQGGYYPIVYDFTKDTRLDQKIQDDIAKSGMVGNAVLGMRRGHVKKRSQNKVSYKLLFEFGSIGTAIDDVIHNIAYRAAVRDVNRIVNNKEFKETFATDEYFGVKAHSVLNQWVKDNWAMQRQRLNGFEKAMDRLLKNQSIVVLGYRTKTALLNAVNIVPAFKYLLQNTGNASAAITHFAAMKRTPKQAIAFAKSKSAMMRDRGAINDFNVKDTLKQAKPSVLPFKDEIMNNSFRLISMTDELVAVPLWNGIYEFTISENATAVADGNMSIEEVECLAITMADKAVRQVFGSNDIKDRAAIQRTTSFMKFFNPFYSYFNVMYNSVAKDVSVAYNKRDKSSVARAVFSGFMWFVVTGAFEELIRYIISSDDDNRKDRRSPFARVAQSSVGNVTGTIPLVRDFSQIALKQIFEGNSYGQQMRPSVGMEIFNRGIIASKTAQDLINNRGRKEWLDFGREINQIFNAWYGVPDTFTNSIWTTIDVLDKGNSSFADYIYAVLFNKKLK